MAAARRIGPERLVRQRRAPRPGAAGIDLDRITADLEADGVKRFASAYDDMLAAIAGKRQKTLALPGAA